jgi:parallel beta-helix repeat protein
MSVIGATAAATVGAVIWLPAVPGAAEVPSGWVEIARDGFDRKIGGQWGSAPLGGSYTLTGSNSGVGVAGTVAYAKIGAGKKFTATLKGVSARDVDVADTVTLASGASSFDLLHGWNGRVQTDGSAYTARVRYGSSGKPTLAVSRLNGSASTWLSGVDLPFTTPVGAQIRGEISVTGTSPVTVKARAWRVGSAVPGWQVSYSDTSAARIQNAGAASVWHYLQSSNAVAAINTDNVQVSAPSGTAQPAPAPPPPPPAGGGRGSLPVGSASYPIPAGAIFVDAGRGNNSNSGSQSSPLKTVGAAVMKIPSNGAGTIVLRGGTYHESVKAESNRSATIQNYPGEAVWFDGSVPVTNWTKSGTRWVAGGWKAEFSSSMGGSAAFKAQFLDTNMMAAHPDQVFLNGAALTQVGSAAAVVAGTFYVNDAADTITIGSDPTGKEVRASDLKQAIFLGGKNSWVQGIGVRRYANPYELKGAVRVINPGGGVRNVVVQDVATLGISVSNPSKTIDRVTVQRAGMIGLGGYMADNSTITNSILNNNNSQRFKDAPEAGGLKFTASRTVTVKNIEANNNIGASGIWFDVSSYNLTIVNNFANGNTKYGIEVEVSGRGIIANNQAIGGEASIILFDSHDFKVFNNEVGNNTLFGIKLAQDQRRQASLGTETSSRDPRVTGVDPTVTWVVKNIQLSNNVVARGNGSVAQVYAMDGRSRRDVDTWNLTINGNLFNAKRVAAGDAHMVMWGNGDNTTYEKFDTPAALASAKNSTWKNAQVSTFQTIAEMSDDKTAFASVAVPIPSDVASASGRLTAGSKVLGIR